MLVCEKRIAEPLSIPRQLLYEVRNTPNKPGAEISRPEMTRSQLFQQSCIWDKSHFGDNTSVEPRLAFRFWLPSCRVRNFTPGSLITPKVLPFVTSATNCCKRSTVSFARHGQIFLEPTVKLFLYKSRQRYIL